MASAKKKAGAKKAPAVEEGAANGTKRYKYAKVEGVKTTTGRTVVDCGDAIAVALRGKDFSEVKTILKENGADVNKAWDAIHVGRAKMSASNVLRGMVRRGEKVKIDGRIVKTLDAATA